MVVNGAGEAGLNSTSSLFGDDGVFNMTTNSTHWLGTNTSAPITQGQATLLTSVTNATVDIFNKSTSAATTTLPTSTTTNGTFVFNHTLSPFVTDGQDFFQHLSPKDETLFLTLIIMGVLIPVLFISIFALVCIRKKKERRARRAERLLRNAQDLAMDDYPPALYKIQALRA